MFFPSPQAAFYYQLAASQGHNLAQYRYARCMLQDPGSSWDHEQQRAVSMLKRAADSGLREVSAVGRVFPGYLGHVELGSNQNTFLLPPWPQAQAFLGVLFTKEPYVDEQRAVKYLWLAANNGVWGLHIQAWWGSNRIKEGIWEWVPCLEEGW